VATSTPSPAPAGTQQRRLHSRRDVSEPLFGEAGDGAANAADESVSPSFSRKPTQGNGSGAIPLGLRDLVKDYFSSLDQK
jgi:hypothetical protein